MGPPTTADSGRQTAAPGASTALALLLSINLFNYIDRYVLAAVLPKIAADPEIGPLSMAALEREARSLYAGNLFLARDFDRYALDRQGTLNRLA